MWDKQSHYELRFCQELLESEDKLTNFGSITENTRVKWSFLLYKNTIRLQNPSRSIWKQGTYELPITNWYINSQLVLLLAAASAIHAQYITPAITSQNSNIYRTLGNLGQVSTHSKTIDTPYSSVSKSDVRVSNPGIATYGGYGVAPALSPLGYAGIHAPLGVHAPIGVHSPLALSHGISSYGVAPGHVIAAPRLAGVPVAKSIAAPGLLGMSRTSVSSHWWYNSCSNQHFPPLFF